MPSRLAGSGEQVSDILAQDVGSHSFKCANIAIGKIARELCQLIAISLACAAAEIRRLAISMKGFHRRLNLHHVPGDDNGNRTNVLYYFSGNRTPKKGYPIRVVPSNRKCAPNSCTERRSHAGIGADELNAH